MTTLVETAATGGVTAIDPAATSAIVASRVRARAQGWCVRNGMVCLRPSRACESWRAGASARRLTLRATLGARPRNAPEAGRAGPAPGLVSLSAARYGTSLIRFCGPGATGEGELATKYATSASRWVTPMSGAVPAVKRVKPSAPAARKLFIVSRYE